MREQITESDDLVGRNIMAVTYDLATDSIFLTLTPNHFGVFAAGQDSYEPSALVFLNSELPELSSSWLYADICTENEFLVLDALNMLTLD